MKDRQIYCLNNIAKVGTDCFRKGYTLTDSIEDAAGVLVRSADMKETAFPAGLRALARALEEGRVVMVVFARKVSVAGVLMRLPSSAYHSLAAQSSAIFTCFVS